MIVLYKLVKISFLKSRRVPIKMNIKSFEFLKKFLHTAEGVGCVLFSIFSILVLSRPETQSRRRFPATKGETSLWIWGNLVMDLGKPRYGFGETSLWIWGNLVMDLGKPRYGG